MLLLPARVLTAFIVRIRITSHCDQVLPFSNPTSCCFSRGRLLVGSSMTRSAGHLHHFTAAVHVLDATSWEKQGILVSQE